VCLISGAVLGWGTWYYTNDSVSYLDIARYVSAHNWSAALNPFWGLSYPWLLGLFFSICGHGLQSEINAVRLLSIVIYAAALFSFNFLLSSILQTLKHPENEDPPLRLMLSDAAICVVGYAVFLWTALCVSYVSRVSPDMLVAAIFFAAIALLLRIRTTTKPLLLCILFGLLLAFGYYTKAIFVPLASVMFPAMFLVLRGSGIHTSRTRVTCFAVSFAVLVVAIAPYFLMVSSKRGGLPSAGALNHEWHVDGLWKWRHWQGGDDHFGHPLHTTRQISTDIRAYEFYGPVPGTFAPWYDPSYWFAGFKDTFSISNQMRALLHNTRELLRYLSTQAAAWGFLACFAGLVWTGQRRSEIWKDWEMLWPLLACSATGTVIYLAVHVEPRYLQAMLCGIVLSMIAPLRAAPGATVKRASIIVIAVAASAVAISLAITIPSRTAGFSFANPLASDADWKLAGSLGEDGVMPGAKVAIIGNGMRCLWAYLGRVTIIAEVPYGYDEDQRKGDSELFWRSSPERQQALLARFKAVGVTTVVADHLPPGVDTTAWISVPGTQYFYRKLDAVAAH